MTSFDFMKDDLSLLVSSKNNHESLLLLETDIIDKSDFPIQNIDNNDKSEFTNNIKEIKIPEWKMDIILRMKNKIKRKGKVLKFIHIPKCAGSYASQYIDNLNIINKGHHVATIFDKFSFTIIRNPVDRLISLLNYRLNAPHPRRDWPERLKDFHYDKSKTLDDVILNMTDKEIISFNPYRTLKHWTQNIKLLITVDEFIPTLKLLDYNIDNIYLPKNISYKNRGILSDGNRERIANIYNEDMKLYEHWTRII
jgi:hypothetical protein